MTRTEDLYVTRAETLYPNECDFNEIVVRLYCRTESQEYRTVTVRGFDPFFYTTTAAAEAVNESDHSDLLRYEETDVTALRDRFASLTPWRETRELRKVIVSHPGAVPNLRKHFDVTWGADTLFFERFRIEKGIKTGVRVETADTRDGGTHIVAFQDEIQPVEMSVEPRVLTLDIELDDRGDGFPSPGEARILSIVTYDSYDDETVAFIDLHGRTLEEHFNLDKAAESIEDLGLEGIDHLEFADTEWKMLTKFSEYVENANPDLITGWNSGDASVDGFDLPHIIKRMKGSNTNPNRLSRTGSVSVDSFKGNHKPSITGRALYDLMDGWGDTKFTEPRSFKLDYAAEQELGYSKIEHDMGYYEMYREAPVKFLNYNARDVEITAELGEDIISFKQRLKDMTGVDWRRTHQNNEFIEMSVRRKCNEHNLVMITAYDNEYVGGDTDEVNYEGAYVFPSFDGVKKNVAGIDLASLYPMTQWMLNASPDTRIDRAKAWQNDIDHVVAENGQTFRNDVNGIIRELVDEYRQLKAEFKEKRNAAEYGSDEYEEAAETYNVTKTIYNSYYGFSGWNRSPLYNPHDAAAITLTGQEVIKRTADYIEEQSKGEVIYGDTDSTYVQFPTDWSQEKTLETVNYHCKTLNNDVYPEFCSRFNIPAEDNRWNIEPEMRAERFFMSGSKKHYAYLKMWDEGDDFDEKINDGDGKFSVTGYQCVKSNTALLTKQLQENVLERVVRGADKAEVANLIFETASSIKPDDPDWEKIGIPQGLGQSIDPDNAGEDGYYSWSETGQYPKGEAPRAAWFANHLLGLNLGEGSKPKRVKVKPERQVKNEPVDVIAYTKASEIEGEAFTVDVQEMQRKLIENPMTDIVEALDLKMEQALLGNVVEQENLSSFM